MPMIFDRDTCRDLNETIKREWLVTNGLGGYAAGTVAGVLTRMQHGLLVASPRVATSQQLLLAKIDEEVVFDQRAYDLGTNEYRDGAVNPGGFVHMESFRLEEGFPVFTYRLGGADGIMLEKRIWMPHGQDTTYIQYRVLRTPREQNGSIHTYNAPDNWVRVMRNSVTDASAAPLTLSITLLPFVAQRPIDQPLYGNLDWHYQIETYKGMRGGNRRSLLLDEEEPLALPEGAAGCLIRAHQESAPFSLFVSGHPNNRVSFIPTGVWYWHFLRRADQAAGRPAIDDLYLPGVFRAVLWPGEDSVLTVIVTAENMHGLAFTPEQSTLSYKRCIEQQRSLLYPQQYFGEGGVMTPPVRVLPLKSGPDPQDPEALSRQLYQAADRFIVRRAAHHERHSRPLSFYESAGTPAIVTDYFTRSYNTREALIALPGLLLATRRFDEAQSVLRFIARHFRHGLLPDHVPPPGQETKNDDYGSVDTALWFFNALDHYLLATRDNELLDELYQRFVNIIEAYIQGAGNGIQVDAADGLLRAQQPGKALTWMNASTGGTPVTPRGGKPVEVNALWYNALMLMDGWSRRLHLIGYITHQPTIYKELAEQCRASFNRRFWNAGARCLFDVVDGPSGDDPALRPNQLLALSLRHPILNRERRQNVLDAIERHLLTPYGLRTLAPTETGYLGRPGMSDAEQQAALHQGSAWPWLFGAYVDALLDRDERDTSPAGRSAQNEKLRTGTDLIERFLPLLSEGMLGMAAGAYSGDAPASPSCHVASAQSMGEILRAYTLLADLESRPAEADVAFIYEEERTPRRPSYVSTRK